MRCSSARGLAVACLLGAAACDPPNWSGDIWGYDPRLPGGLTYHWPLGRTISVFVDPTAGGDALRDVVLPSAASWRDSVYFAEFTVRVVEDAASADVILHTRDAPLLVATGTCVYSPPGAAGVTFFCPAETGDTLEVLELLAGGPGHVKMDVAIDLSRIGGATTVRAIVAHELGHVLGIGSHSNDVEDLMYSIPTVERPSAYDAAALRWVLQQPRAIRP